jgi:phage gp29-like protein
MLYDYLGRPVKTRDLTREHAAPALTGIRTIWNDTYASGLTPVGLAALLRAAADGDHHAYLTLAEEMEERDLHYAAELGKRKLAVSRLPITVESATDAARDKELAEAVRVLTRGTGFRGLLKDLLDALGKGFACCEITWQTSARWPPVRYQWRDPRFFQWDQASRSEVRLREESDLIEGLALPPYKFITHVHRGKSGLPIRGGIARLAAWAFMCKGYTVKDWLAFAEVFGMPLRLGRYGASAREDEIAILKTAVANLGTDAAAVFPESMQVELIEAGNKGGSADFFERLANYLDNQVSKGVLGQTASSSGTPGKLGNEDLQGEVRDDIRDDDAEALEATINRDLVRPFVDLNFGPQEQYPEVQLRAIPAEDVAALVSAVEKLVPFGLRVEQSVIRDKLGLPDPDPRANPEDLLRPTSSQAEVMSPEHQGVSPDGQIASPGSQGVSPEGQGGADQAKAANAAAKGNSFTPEQQALEDLADRALAGVDLGANETRIVDAVQAAGSWEEAVENLLALWPDMEMESLQAMVERAIVAAEMFGRVNPAERE